MSIIGDLFAGFEEGALGGLFGGQVQVRNELSNQMLGQQGLLGSAVAQRSLLQSCLSQTVAMSNSARSIHGIARASRDWLASTCCIVGFDSHVDFDEEETEMVNVTYVVKVDGDDWEKVASITGAEIDTVQKLDKIKVNGVKFTKHEVEYDTEEGYIVTLLEIDKATRRQILKLGKAGFEKVGLVVDGKIKRI